MHIIVVQILLANVVVVEVPILTPLDSPRAQMHPTVHPVLTTYLGVMSRVKRPYAGGAVTGSPGGGSRVDTLLHLVSKLSTYLVVSIWYP